MSRIDAAHERHTGHRDQVHDLVRRWTQRDPDAIKRSMNCSPRSNSALDHVVAQVVGDELANVERVQPA